MSNLWPPVNSPGCSYITQPPAKAYQKKSPHKLAILGSTGSIGKNALAVAAAASDLRVHALAAGENIALLAEQALKFNPPYLAVKTEELANRLAALLPTSYQPRILWGQYGYAELASLADMDIVLSAQSGTAGLCATLAAARAGKVIALANKESLVMAGSLLRRLASETGSAILPVDSEHYAIFQCIAGNPGREISRVILTASGGPFHDWTAAELKKATLAQALKHPNWSMGARITIDSATLMNKGLEFIEAMHLFGLKADKIDILIHPQSIVHSLAEFTDYSQLAQMAVPDMRLPIAACLLWPCRATNFVKRLDLTQTGALTFKKPDMRIFPCLAHAIKAANYVPTAEWQEIGVNPACVILTAANEAAVDLALAGKCPFAAIGDIVGSALWDTLAQCPHMSVTLPATQNAAQYALSVLEMIQPVMAQAKEAVQNLAARI